MPFNRFETPRSLGRANRRLAGDLGLGTLPSYDRSQDQRVITGEPVTMEAGAGRDDGIVRCFASDLQSVSPMPEEMYDLDARGIMQILPHRFPLLLVDRIVELHPLERIVGYKNISFNEPVLRGHFPGNPIFPGVYIIEALAQLAGCIVLEPGQFWKNPPYLTGIDKAKFRHPVVPGDRLMMDVRMRGHRRNVFWMSGVAFVEGEVVCTAGLTFAVALQKLRASFPRFEDLDRKLDRRSGPGATPQ